MDAKNYIAMFIEGGFGSVVGQARAQTPADALSEILDKHGTPNPDRKIDKCSRDHAAIVLYEMPDDFELDPGSIDYDIVPDCAFGLGYYVWAG